jgi:hypothetical protein
LQLQTLMIVLIIIITIITRNCSTYHKFTWQFNPLDLNHRLWWSRVLRCTFFSAWRMGSLGRASLKAWTFCVCVVWCRCRCCKWPTYVQEVPSAKETHEPEARKLFLAAFQRHTRRLVRRIAVLQPTNFCTHRGSAVILPEHRSKADSTKELKNRPTDRWS